ncbi:MAG: hypothetical protein NVS9B13_25900 [Candidatus Acidiferrum sp.]
MCRLSLLIHRADFPSDKEFETCGERIDIGGSHHGDATRGKKPSDIAKEADGAFYMLDDFDGSDHAEGVEPDRRCKVWLIEINRYMPRARFVSVGVSIGSQHIKSKRLKACRHCTRPRAKIGGFEMRNCETSEDPLAYKLVKTAIRRRVQH